MSFICRLMRCALFLENKNNKRRQQLLQIEIEERGYIFRSASEKAIEEIQAEMQGLQQLYEELKEKRVKERCRYYFIDRRPF